uniref:Replication protein n=1 Tax=uncultured prokaryote TaxID=198431 RepID=A0A0H5Q2Z4_9ZZZZ|nr:hypothetical protein [uncultured prokaryote]
MPKRARTEANKKAENKYDEKRKGKRTRNWTVISYPDDLPENWQEMLDDKCIKWICSPLHDKDLNADGQPKKPHYHLLLMFDAVKAKNQVVDIFGELFGFSENDSIIGIATPQTVSDRCALVRYMAHLDNPSKVQYDVADIVGHCGADPAEIMRYNQTETINMMIEIEEFIEDKNITELCDLSSMIRYEHPDWYTMVATKCTVYFNAYIRSRRHKMQRIDPDTGELM